jgi:tungstate transport system substrate-binding protein
LATTTSTHNSGLLDDLLPPFEEREGIEIQVIPVGTGQALALGERGDADVVLVHAREREDAFVAAGHGVERRDIMWNDFIVAGPRSDPADVRGLRDAAEAFRRIRASRARFVSRGDDSGTHIRELAVWKATGQEPPRGLDHYLEAGQGMGRCLTIAGEKRAYVLADRGTFLAYRSRLELEVLVEGDRLLRNPYGAMLVNPTRHPHVPAVAARKLLDYLTSEEGQRRIGAFRVDGQVLFHPATTKG